MSRHPLVKWAQREDKVYLTVLLSESAAYVYGLVGNEKFQSGKAVPNWSPHHQVMPVSSPSSCVSSFSSNSMLDFSTTKSNTHGIKHQPQPDHSSEVRKEKLGDRITTLHQLVSPFGKTDTSSVLLEAIGYIRFLQNQIEALSLPYLGSGSGNMSQQQSECENTLVPRQKKYVRVGVFISGWRIKKAK